MAAPSKRRLPAAVASSAKRQLFTETPTFATLTVSAAALSQNLTAIMDLRKATGLAEIASPTTPTTPTTTPTTAQVAVVGRAGITLTPLSVPDLEPSGPGLLLVGGHAAEGDNIEPLPWLQAVWCHHSGTDVPFLVCLGFAWVQVFAADGRVLFKHALSVDPTLPG